MNLGLSKKIWRATKKMQKDATLGPAQSAFAVDCSMVWPAKWMLVRAKSCETIYNGIQVNLFIFDMRAKGPNEINSWSYNRCRGGIMRRALLPASRKFFLDKDFLMEVINRSIKINKHNDEINYF